jgi:hypothetical protein
LEEGDDRRDQGENQSEQSEAVGNQIVLRVGDGDAEERGAEDGDAKRRER